MKRIFEDFYYSVKYRGNEIFDLIFKDLPRIAKNFWIFRKAIAEYRWYGGHNSVFPLLETAIADMAVNIKEKGYEIDESRLKKVAKMERLVKLLNDTSEDKFTEYAENEIGELFHYDIEFEPSPNHPSCYQLVDKKTPEEKEHNSKVFKRSREIEKETWDEIWEILKGQDCSEFDKDIDWEKQFDGTGIRGWWD
jgi:hypothetical protein